MVISSGWNVLACLEDDFEDYGQRDG